MTVNTVIMYSVAVCAILGAIDRIIGNRFGLGEKFDEGFAAMGPLALGMVGMVCLTPLISEKLGAIIAPVFHLFGADPAMFGALLANDMGGYSLAMSLAESKEAGYLAGCLVAPMLGCTLVFSIPVGMGMIEAEDRPYFCHGLLIGLLTVPVGSFLGGLVAGFSVIPMIKNLIPVTIFSALLAFGLWKIPAKMIKGCQIFGRVMTAVIYAALAAGVFESITGIVLIPGMAPISDGLKNVCDIGVVLLGALPMVTILSRILKKPFDRLGQKMDLDKESMMGLLTALAIFVPVFSRMKHMKKRGIVVNTAWIVGAGCALGDHLGFTAGVASEMIAPMVVAKIAAGAAAVFIALTATKNIKN